MWHLPVCAHPPPRQLLERGSLSRFKFHCSVRSIGNSRKGRQEVRWVPPHEGKKGYGWWVPHSSPSNLSWWGFSCEFLYHFRADGLLLKLKNTHSWLQAGNTFGDEFTVWVSGKALLISSFLYEKDTSSSAVHIPFTYLVIKLSLPTWRQSAHIPILSRDGLQSPAVSTQVPDSLLCDPLWPLSPDIPALHVPLAFFQQEDAGANKDTSQAKNKKAARTGHK